MKATIPGKVVNAGRGFEENDRCARGSRGLASHLLCQACDFEIVEPADKSALEALFEEFREAIHAR
jgi:hypothetical protein